MTHECSAFGRVSQNLGSGSCGQKNVWSSGKKNSSPADVKVTCSNAVRAKGEARVPNEREDAHIDMHCSDIIFFFLKKKKA